MGRRKIDIEEIVDTKKRIVTFSKRRTGLERKLAQLCKLCADIVFCLIVFSPAGRAYTFSNSPSGACEVVERFVEEYDKNDCRSKNSTQRRNKAGVGSRSDDSYWWDIIDMEKLDSVEKLKAMRETLANLKQNLLARKEKLTVAAASSPLSSLSSTIDDTIMKDRMVEDDTAATITEEQEAWENCAEGHPNLDLNLSLGWQFKEKTSTSLLEDDEEEFPLLTRGQTHTLTELALF
ncbi:hypothetical protein MKW94_028251 [Papaver nudicaule]|uniref:MADS-box domain-containing protein n=1 Tax=Papaver nudicaule TaxID=74823 RepID=A0AA41SDT8_PAPNU|nr:hypothetical protein [Papaver nudicaule]